MKLATTSLLLATAATATYLGAEVEQASLHPNTLWQMAFIYGKGYDVTDTKSVLYDDALRPIMEMAE